MQSLPTRVVVALKRFVACSAACAVPQVGYQPADYISWDLLGCEPSDLDTPTIPKGAVA